ncbi:MAG: hypothetical protein MUF86_00360 [Akkermansiaceae bacterium]|jgi:hypothetical protein|nr:hypothetical protein [Akkermansiaceae bacterium]MCU0776106.1 hypothetical protein [Akkermansiaceae bacterium]
MSNILQHLKERLRQRTLRQQITRSKTITPILDAVNEAARLEGISPDEIVADFISGKTEHPVITAALSSRPSITRDQAAKQLAETEKTLAALRQRPRVAPSASKPTAASVKPTPAPPAEMPRGLDGKGRRAWQKSQSVMSAENAKNFTDTYLQAAATHPNSPPAEAAIARAELEARGWVFSGRIISKSLRKN